jgi:hypothetical protein
MLELVVNVLKEMRLTFMAARNRGHKILHWRRVRKRRLIYAALWFRIVRYSLPPP